MFLWAVFFCFVLFFVLFCSEFSETLWVGIWTTSIFHKIVLLTSLLDVFYLIPFPETLLTSSFPEALSLIPRNRTGNEVTSHYAWYFISRGILLSFCSQSCRYPLDTAAVEEGSSLAGHLSKIDPSRLMRLALLSLTQCRKLLNTSWAWLILFFGVSGWTSVFSIPLLAVDLAPLLPSPTRRNSSPNLSLSLTGTWNLTSFSPVLESGVKLHSPSYKHGCCSHHSYVFNHHLTAAVYTEILKVSRYVHGVYQAFTSGQFLRTV